MSEIRIHGHQASCSAQLTTIDGGEFNPEYCDCDQSPMAKSEATIADLRERLAKAEAEVIRRERLFCEAIISTQTNASARLTCDVQELLTHYNKARDAELGKENSNG